MSQTLTDVVVDDEFTPTGLVTTIGGIEVEIRRCHRTTGTYRDDRLWCDRGHDDTVHWHVGAYAGTQHWIGTRDALDDAKQIAVDLGKRVAALNAARSEVDQAEHAIQALLFGPRVADEVPF